MALPLDSAPKCTLPLGWGTAPFWTVEKPETGEPHASPCGDPRTEEYDAVLRELKALMHTLLLTQAWPVFSSMVTWRILEMEKRGRAVWKRYEWRREVGNALTKNSPEEQIDLAQS